MKFAVIFLFLISSHLYSFDPGSFEKNQCGRMFQPLSRNGFFRLSPPLSYVSSGQRSYLQRVFLNNEWFHLFSENGLEEVLGGLKNVRDYLVYEDRIWLLDDFHLYEFSLEGRRLGKYSYSKTTDRREKPRGFFRVEDDLYISSGRLGLIAFNLRSGKFRPVHDLNTLQDDGGKSLAVSITGDKEKLYILMTGNTENAFNGIVIFDLKKGDMVKTTPYNRRRHGVISPDARIFSQADSLFINNGGWIHRFEKKDLYNRRAPAPNWLSIRAEYDGRQSFLMIRGDFIFDGNQIHGCAMLDDKVIATSRGI